MKYLITLTLLLFSSIFLSGCVLELGLMEEIGFADAAVTAEEGAALEASSIELAGGRLTLANEAALERIELRRVPGENPKLFSQGKTQPFAEVLPREGKARLLGNHSGTFTINENIFSVEGNTVNMRSTPSSFSSENIITKVKHGNMVVALSEDAGWYQVKIAQNGKIIGGWINAAYLMPLVGDSSNHHLANQDQPRKLDPTIIIYPDVSKIKSDLIGKSTKSWTFSRVTEFTDLKIEAQKVNGNNVSQKVNITLVRNQSQYITELMMRYSLQGDHWQLSGISEISFRKTCDINSNSYSTTSQQVPVYTVGYILQNRPPVESLQSSYVNTSFANRLNKSDYRSYHDVQRTSHSSGGVYQTNRPLIKRVNIRRDRSLNQMNSASHIRSFSRYQQRNYSPNVVQRTYNIPLRTYQNQNTYRPQSGYRHR